MSLAMSAAPLAVWLPATAQLLLPVADALTAGPGAAGEVPLSRTLSAARPRLMSPARPLPGFR